MTSESLFSRDYTEQPLWWQQTPRPQLPDTVLPARAEVIVIGSGYTGLCAAIQTARAGRDTLVLDSGYAGWGCSTRNGGQVSTGLKSVYSELVPKYGADLAARIVAEGQRALAWIGDFIQTENIDCDFRRVGRFHAAHKPAQYERLARRFSDQPRGLEVDAHLVSKAEQQREIGSEVYHGGMVFAQHASVDPARYHQGLLERALAAGVRVITFCKVNGFEREAGEVRIDTARGRLSADELIVATNGYTGSATPWQRRRVIPIGSYIIATEPFSVSLMDELIPKDRVITDTRKLVYYYRASPDRTRMIFGGRVSIKETNPRLSAKPLYAEMVRLFPQLRGVKISHSWMGFVAYTFDEMPHLGCHDGVYYAMGYCGSGITLASYFGTRIAQRLTGSEEGATALDGIRFQTRPLYRGKPWFLAPTIRYYRWRDR